MFATALATASGVGVFQDFIQYLYAFVEFFASNFAEVGLKGRKFILKLVFIHSSVREAGMRILLEPSLQLHPLSC